MNNKKNIIFITLAGILVYINSLKNNFVWDDILLIIDNDFIKGPGLIKEIFLKPLYYLTDKNCLYYRPVQALSYIFDYSLWGLNPFGFHLANVILHTSAAILFYYFVELLFKDRELSFFSSLLFIVHPMNTSVVNYIASRADILLTIFTISSLLFFLEARHYKFYLLSLSCFILALLSKESALIFPLFLIFTNEIYLKIKNKKRDIAARLSWYIVFIIISIIYILLRIKVIGVGANIFAPANINSISIFSTSSKIIFNYLKLIYLPLNLHILRNIPIIYFKNNFLSAIVIFGIPFLFIIYRLFSFAKEMETPLLLRRNYSDENNSAQQHRIIPLDLRSRINKIIFFSLGLFLLWILPMGLMALKNPEYYFQQRAIMAESWLYIPAMGIFILTVYGIKKLSKYLFSFAKVMETSLLLRRNHSDDNNSAQQHRIIPLDLRSRIGKVFYGMGKYKTLSQPLKLHKGSSESRLWRDEVSCKTILLLFVSYLSILTLRENTYWKDNLTLFTHTSKYVHNSITAYRNLGWIYLNKKDLNKSIEMYLRALALKQDDKHRVVLYKDLAYAYFLNNQVDEASNMARQAINIEPNFADAYALLGLSHSKNDLQKDTAREEWRAALELDPFNGLAFNSLLMLSKTENNILKLLIEKYNRCFKQYERFEQYRVYRALGIIYLYNGMRSSAISYLEKARQINPYDVKINNALAVYYVESGDFDRAIKYFKIALRLNPFEQETYKNLAALYTQLNRAEEARILIERAGVINMFN